MLAQDITILFEGLVFKHLNPDSWISVLLSFSQMIFNDVEISSDWNRIQKDIEISSGQ